MNPTFPPPPLGLLLSRVVAGTDIYYIIHFHIQLKNSSPPSFFFSAVDFINIKYLEKKHKITFIRFSLPRYPLVRVQLVGLDCPNAIVNAFLFSNDLFILFTGTNTTVAVVSTLSA